MAEPFPVSGNIEPASFPHLLVDLHRHGATGSFKVTGPVHPKALYFRGGKILFGSSNDPRDQLGAILIESGRITREQLDEVNAKVGPGNPLAKVLSESGFVNQRELGDAARVKVERILADVLSWSTGTFEFEDGVLPKGAVDLKLSTEKLLLAAVGRVTDRAFALRHVELSTVLEPAPEPEAGLAEIRAEVWPLLERLDGRRTLKDAIALTRLDEFEAAKLACAMIFLGIVRRKAAAAGGQELDLAEEAQSAFDAEPETAHFTMPVDPEIAARLASADPSAFSFADPEPPRDASAGPGPDRATDTVMLGFPALAPEPEAAPEAEPLGVLPEGRPATPTAEAPAFFVDAPSRPPSETEPGDRPVYVPPAWESSHASAEPEPELLPLPQPEPTYRVPAYEPPAPPEPEPPPAPSYRPPSYEAPPPRSLPEIPTPPPPSTRPTQEDLAALDALLNPSSTGRLSGSPVTRPRVERAPSESQVRRPPTQPARRAPVRPAKATPTRTPFFLAVGGVGIVLATAAAWYFFLRSPTNSTPPPPTVARATPLPPPTTLATEPSPAATAPVTAATPTAAPRPAATASPTPLPRPTPTPTPTPAPKATPPPARTAPPSAPVGTPPAAATGGAGDPRALMRRGTLPEAAQAFAASLAPGARSRFSLQVLVACAPDNVQKAVAAVPDDELFIVPVNVKGKACYRVCWGVYDTRAAAEAALGGLPGYFRQGGAVPRLAPLAELLP